MSSLQSWLTAYMAKMGAQVVEEEIWPQEIGPRGRVPGSYVVKGEWYLFGDGKDGSKANRSQCGKKAHPLINSVKPCLWLAGSVIVIVRPCISLKMLSVPLVRSHCCNQCATTCQYQWTMPVGLFIIIIHDPECQKAHLSHCFWGRKRKETKARTEHEHCCQI